MGETAISNFLLPISISISTRPINGRQNNDRLPLCDSYNFVYESNTCFISLGNSIVSFLNVGQNCDDNINDDNGNNGFSKKKKSKQQSIKI